MRFRSRSGSFLSAGVLCALAIALSACAQMPGTQVAAVGPIPPGGARIWFYREFEPSISLNDANVALNGVLAASVPADGRALYRDVAPGRYHVTVDSYGQDVNQAKDIELSPGGEGFVKILAAEGWESSGDLTQLKRDTFYVSVVPPQIARGELNHPLSGG